MICINITKKEYTKTVDAIALGMLLQAALTQLIPNLAARLLSALSFDQSSVAFENFCACVDIVVYILMFFLPALFISKYVSKPSCDISYKKAFPDNMLLITVGSIGIIAISGNAANIVNSMASVFGIGFKAPALTFPKDILGVILLVISTAIVPAIVEEILFRKVILNSLLPYGKMFAIVASALLFSTMHCNPSQFLYAFVAGVIFAVIAIKTGSVIPSMIIHFFNNLISAIYITVYAFAPENVYIYTVTGMDTLICILGLILGGIMLKNKFFNIEISDTEKQQNEESTFSPVTSCVRILLILYVLYSSFLTARWIYII